MHQVPAPRQLHQQYDTASLFRQFILSRSREVVPLGWVFHEAAGWCLGVNGIQVINLLQHDEVVGWVVGDPLNLQTGFLKQEASVEDFFRQLPMLSGRFIVLRVAGSTPEVRLDACGSLAAVFCPEQEIVASSPMLIPYTPGSGDNTTLIQASGIPHRNGIYPFGLTPRRGVERLLPNHRLALDSWAVEREWGIHPAQPVESLRDAVDEIVSILQSAIKWSVRTGGAYAPLTAGNDSRALLSCSKEYIDGLRFFTAEYRRGDATATVDVDVARRIAADLGLDHRVLQYVKPDDTQLDRFVYETGYSVGEVRGWSNVATMEQLGDSGVFLTGHLGEVGRVLYWRSDAEYASVTPEGILDKVHAPTTTESVVRARHWLDQLESRDAAELSGLLHLEQRVGGWLGPAAYGVARVGGIRVIPFAHRRIFELMLGLPSAYRSAGGLVRDIMLHTWPSLLDYPTNEPVSSILRAKAQFRSYTYRASRRLRRVARTIARQGPLLRK